MAEEQQDESQKTEDPTPRKLEQAREKGQVARSQEVNHWFMILAFGVVVGVFGEGILAGVERALVRFVERPHQLSADAGSLGGVLVDTLMALAGVLVLPVAVMLVAALAAGLLQTGVVISAESLKPKAEKISPRSGFKRLFSSRSLTEFAKGILKLAIVATVVAVLLWPKRDMIADAVRLPPEELLALLQSTGLLVVGGVLAVMTVIAALDFLYQKFQHTKQLRMSRQEIKDEYKQTEGDPQVKQRLRQLRMERSRRRMMAAVPEADVVVTNPTHYAVALAYQHGEMEAPRVVAKGADRLARKIREVADEHDVPRVENPPLARALYDGVELDQEIPPQHYKAVAEIIGYVMRLKRRPMPGARR